MKKTSYKARRLIISLCVVICISLILMGFTSSQVSYNDCSIYGNCKPVSKTGTTINNYTNVTGSSFNISNNNVINISNNMSMTTILGLPGNYTRIGDATPTGVDHGLTTNDDFQVTGKFVSNSNAFFDKIVQFGSTDGTDMFAFLVGDITQFLFSAVKGDGLHWAPRNTLATAGRNNIFVDYTYRSNNYSHFLSPNPTIILQSSTPAATSKIQWLGLSHNTVNGEFDVGTGGYVFANGSMGVGINTLLYTVPPYNLTVGNGTATSPTIVSIYSEGNISAAGYITRTSTYDKSKGKALDLIQDADYYKKNGKADDSKFFGYVTYTTKENDLSKPIVTYKTEEVCTDDVRGLKTTCVNQSVKHTDYPTKDVINEGVSLDSEINLLKQAVYELKLQNADMQKSLCNLGEKQWC